MVHPNLKNKMSMIRSTAKHTRGSVTGTIRKKKKSGSVILRTLKGAGKGALKVVKKSGSKVLAGAAKGAISGALLGGSIGGPAGAASGALAAGAAGAGMSVQKLISRAEKRGVKKIQRY